MTATTIIIFLALGIIFLFIFLYFVPINLWITAVFSGVQVDLFQLVFMRIRKTPPGLIINSLISLNKSGVDISILDLETHYLAGGNIDKVTKGMITAKNTGRELTWQEAVAIDLSGNNIEYFLKKRKIEFDSGVADLRKQLSSAILHDLDEDDVKEVARTVENMKPFSTD